jgi:hypothetical protein
MTEVEILRVIVGELLVIAVMLVVIFIAHR